MEKIKAYLKSNPSIKKMIHSMIISNYRPRLWVRLLWNPFVHKKGKGAIIRSQVRKDVLPFNQFTVGEKTIIESYSVINNAVGDVTIGKECVVGFGNTIIGPIEIQDDVILAQNVVISALNHLYEDVSKPIAKQGVTVNKITIGNNSWIAANVSIVAGVTIGKHCVIGAGAVVTKSIPDYHIAIGNPARLIKKYNPVTKSWEKI
ncbi:acyltransferase [Flammeovirga kamogawensis]|uniref:Acyltransferase n=1 Tax=Flammeovirga kamogawensis TaxID=373891 RepID=A0ABX8H2Y5_9BACT|nr:acyltransferase [Flammeovirga kamogawensis]MBB6460212.1 acetyltransferase-like isoleucine patch superfamily enzyme [Flammeovirga kamogawensis]QWG10024.1 acyltransferase [Flammeovirga kamogawensis]TRX65532.1 acyltransferase [Flammeovirga kamogawensis]